MSAEAVEFGIPAHASFTGIECRVPSSGEMVVGAVPPRRTGRKTVQMTVAIDTKC